MAGEAAAAALRDQGNPLLVKPLAPGEQVSGGRVLQIIPDGVLLNTSDRIVLLKGLNSTNLADGDRIEWRGMAEGVFKYTTALGVESTVRVFRVTQTRP